MDFFALRLATRLVVGCVFFTNRSLIVPRVFSPTFPPPIDSLVEIFSLRNVSLCLELSEKIAHAMPLLHFAACLIAILLGACWDLADSYIPLYTPRSLT